MKIKNTLAVIILVAMTITLSCKKKEPLPSVSSLTNSLPLQNTIQPAVFMAGASNLAVL